MTKSAPRKAMKAIGWLLTLGSFYYIYTVINRNLEMLTDHVWQTSDFVVLMVGSLIACLSILVLGLTWAVMTPLGKDWHSIQRALAAYATTAIFKYLPGNVFHFVGRNLVLSQKREDQVPLASATLFETALSALSAVLLASAGLSLTSNPPYPPSWIIAAFVAAIATFIVISIAAGLRMGTSNNPILSTIFRLVEIPQRVTAASFSAIFSFSIMGMVAAFTWQMTLPPAVGEWTIIPGIYLIGWLIGYIVPGAPGGLGVREAYLVMTLSQYSKESNVLLFALYMRIIFTIADLLIFAIGKLMQQNLKGTQSVAEYSKNQGS